MDIHLDTPETLVNAETLTPFVRRALHSDATQITIWDRQQMRGGVGLGTSVHRFSCQARDGDQTHTWSLILKVLHPVPGHDEPSHWFNWQREAAAYRSGWLDDLPGGIAAPCCFGVDDMLDGCYWLWLDEVQDDIGRKWPLEHYGVAARHLGQFNGAYLVRESWPTHRWLSRKGIRRHIESSAPAIEQVRQFQGRPLVHRFLAHGVDDLLFHAWGDRHRWLDLLDRLPQSICHHDAFRRNMFAQRQADSSFETVLIDWSYAGQGAIGAEVVPLVLGTVGFLEVDLSQARELERIVLDGYVQGLRDVGWQGAPWQVEMGYLASGNRYGLGSVKEILPLMLEDPPPVDVQAVYGCSVEELLDYWNEMWRVFEIIPRTRVLAQAHNL